LLDLPQKNRNNDSILQNLSTLPLAISTCLFLSYLLGIVFNKLKQPKVIAEILVGILIGQGVLGHFFPNVFQSLFSAGTTQGLTTLKDLGLILLMFCSGYELRNLNPKNYIKVCIWGTLLGIGIPALFGQLMINHLDISSLMGPQASIERLKMILTLSMAVTSIPVISRILMDLDLLDVPFSRMILSIAIVEDLILYAMLNSTLTNPQSGSPSEIWTSITKHILITAFFLGIIIFGRNHIYRLARASIFRWKNLETSQYITLILASLLMAVYLLGLVGIVSMISAFACGLVIGSATSEKALEIGENIKRFSFATFIPIYFIMVGFKINIYEDFSLKWILMFLISSSILKTFGGYLAGRFSSFSNLKSIALGVTLNARGGPGIVIASTAFEAGIINGTLFVTLILASLITSSVSGMFLKTYRQEVLQF
jgi:Kef-type K+ transport system membrane component KefB